MPPTTEPPGLAVSPELRARFHLERARARFAMDDVPTGLLEFDLAIALSPDPSSLERLKAWYLEHVARDRQAAIAAYEAAIAADPMSDWAQATREYLEQGLPNYGQCPRTAKPGDDCS